MYETIDNINCTLHRLSAANCGAACVLFHFPLKLERRQTVFSKFRSRMTNVFRARFRNWAGCVCVSSSSSRHLLINSSIAFVLFKYPCFFLCTLYPHKMDSWRKVYYEDNWSATSSLAVYTISFYFLTLHWGAVGLFNNYFNLIYLIMAVKVGECS